MFSWVNHSLKYLNKNYFFYFRCIFRIIKADQRSLAQVLIPYVDQHVGQRMAERE